METPLTLFSFLPFQFPQPQASSTRIFSFAKPLDDGSLLLMADFKQWVFLSRVY